MIAAELTRALSGEHVSYEVIPHRHTETAREEALEIGLSEVAKTVVVATDKGFVRAVIPAVARLDLVKLAAVLYGRTDVRLASEEEMAGAYPMFDLGAVPPVGGPAVDRTVLDRHLALRESIVFEAGSHDSSVRMRTNDVVRLTDAVVDNICKS